MKLFLPIIFTLLFIGYSCKCNRISSNNSAITEVNNRVLSQEKFEVIKIDSIENVYLIYARKNDSIYKIASDKINNSTCNKIQKNKFYELEIKSVFSPNFHQKLDIAGFKFSGTLIKLGDENTVWDLFICENIKGLCYAPAPGNVPN